MSVYDYSVKALDGRDVQLSDYSGDVLLIMNSAIESRFASQYIELERLYERYKGQGFEILDFPCDQFGNQFHGTDEQIHHLCMDRYGITFPQFSSVDVKGKDVEPLFKWLSCNTYFRGFGISPRGIMLSRLVRRQDRDYQENTDVKWDFTKFLVDRTGYVVDRFEPTDMRRLKEGIERYL